MSVAALQLSKAREAAEPETWRCVICDKTACQTADGWWSDYSVEMDEDGDYLAGQGEEFLDAVNTPSGWVCSNQCRSQAMYNRAGEFEKEALRKVHDACTLLSNYGLAALKLVNKETDGYVPDAFMLGACEFLKAVADDGNSMPDWCDREVGDGA